MILEANFRRQAHVCLRLAEACDDQHLAARLKAMAADLFSKADETEERPNENAASQLVACEGAFCGASRGLPVFHSSNGKIRSACRSAVIRSLVISLDAAPSNPANRLDAISKAFSGR